MGVTLDTAQLYEKIGRFYMQVLLQDKELLALREQNGELSQVAGEALRALERLGYADLAGRITRKEMWDDLLVDRNVAASEAPAAPAVAPPGGSPEAGSVSR